MSRHPYTNAADLIREATMDRFDPIGTPCTLSRSQASKIRQCIAEAIGMPDEELAEKLLIAFQAKQAANAA